MVILYEQKPEKKCTTKMCSYDSASEISTKILKKKKILKQKVENSQFYKRKPSSAYVLQSFLRQMIFLELY